MPIFSQTSLKRLETCDPRLQDICQDVIRHFDFVVVAGHRNEEDQNRAYEERKSTKRWPHSKHNTYPSIAVDLAPYKAGKGIDWEDKRGFYLLAGFIIGVAAAKGIRLRWGGDWDKDWDLDDQDLIDLPHFEIVED